MSHKHRKSDALVCRRVHSGLAPWHAGCAR